MIDYQEQALEYKLLLIRLFALPFQDFSQAESYRRMTLFGYGVVPWAIEFIVEHSTFKVDTSYPWGGGWNPPVNYVGKGSIVLKSFQDEGCIHEHSHIYWHWHRHENLWLPLQLAQDLVKVADLDESNHPDEREAIWFSQDYVSGTPSTGWPGMYPEVADVHNLTPEDMDDKVLDWEIFAGLSSFTMGRFRVGRHQLPPALWPYLDRFFTGTIWRRPYYD